MTADQTTGVAETSKQFWYVDSYYNNQDFSLGDGTLKVNMMLPSNQTYRPLILGMIRELSLTRMMQQQLEKVNTLMLKGT
ncbi:MAG: hypothetical protein ACLTOX_03165 [Streptococcus thermophilus]